jgi:hypothetical protein
LQITKDRFDITAHRAILIRRFRMQRKNLAARYYFVNLCQIYLRRTASETRSSVRPGLRNDHVRVRKLA